MIISRRAASLVALVTAAGVFLKVAAEDPVVYEQRESQLRETVVQALTTDGFQVLILPDDPQTVIGLKEDCGIWIGMSKPEGGADSAFIKNYGAQGDLLFWYRGQFSQARPHTSVIADRYMERLKVVVGSEPRVNPLYHVILTKSCDRKSIADLKLTP